MPFKRSDHGVIQLGFIGTIAESLHRVVGLCLLQESGAFFFRFGEQNCDKKSYATTYEDIRLLNSSRTSKGKTLNRS